MDNKRRYFGTDGVRGRVGEEPMTPDFLVRFGFAIGQIFGNQGKNEILIGKDTRLSGYMVESALEAGLSAAGVNTLLSGPIPTSAVSYLTQALRLSAGIVVSASHNPYFDNGVKIFDSDGCKISDEMELAIENAMNDTKILFNNNTGRANRLDTSADRYIEFCKRTIPSSINLHGIRIVADCANGAAYYVAPELFHELGADVVAIGNKPDGLNINVDSGVMAPNAAIKKVVETQADIGIVLDGDADRLYIIDEKGVCHTGDAILYLIVQELRKRNKKVTGVVGTILSNIALENAMKQLGVDFYRAGVGDRQVFHQMIKRDWFIGGETSGHIIMRKFHQTGDGIIAALQVLRAMKSQEKSLSELLADFHIAPQTTKNIVVKNPQLVLHQLPIINKINQVQAELDDTMRLIVRASGTENKIRIMVEGDDTTSAAAIIVMIEQTIKEVLSSRAF